MPIQGSTRFASVWAGLSDQDKTVLRHAVALEHANDDEVIAQLSDVREIDARIEALAEDHFQLLCDVCSEAGLLFETTDPDYELMLEEIFGRGLLVPQNGDVPSSWLAPLEVRLALLDPEEFSDGDLAVLLALHDPEELEDLAQSHQIILPTPSDHLALAESIAHGILDTGHLEQLIASLDEESLTLLLWLIQHDGPIAESSMLDWIEDENLHEGKVSYSAYSVLTHLGLLQKLESGDVSLTLIPSDLRLQLIPLLTASFDQPAANAWAALRDSGQPSFRDAFPRGPAGSPLVTARYRLLRAISEAPDPYDPIDRLIQEFYLFDPQKQSVGELASFHLDVESPDALARHILRVWASSGEDVFTRALLAAFEGDTHTILRWLTEQDWKPGDEAFERQLWLETLIHLRGLLLICLGCLSAGAWYSMEHLTDLMLAVYRRTMWQYGRYRLFAEDFPHNALPVGTEEIQEHHRDNLADVLQDLFEFVFEPIGAAQRDRSGTLFLINSEAFRVFREVDHGFEGLWEATEAILGEDADLWLPIPGEVGSALRGMPMILWHEDGSLSLPVDAPISDLARLAEWGIVRWEGTYFRFEFEEDDFATEEDHAQLEELLVWLVVRSGTPLPDAFRAIVPLSNTVADQDLDAVFAAGRSYVSELYAALDAWVETPSLALMEELRSWGEACRVLLLEKIEEATQENNVESPVLRHNAILLSELGCEGAVPAMLKLFLLCKDERQEGAIGMALAKLGEPAIHGLLRPFFNPTIELEKRLAIAGVLSSAGILHPHLADQIFQELRKLIRDDEIGDDVATVFCAHIAEMGHPGAETLMRELREQGRWFEDVLPFDDALWTAAISPSIWGHPVYAGPLAQIFPNAWESEEVLRAAGVDELMREATVQQENVLGRLGGWRRRH